MNQTSTFLAPKASGSQPTPRVAIVAASWHADIVACATGSVVAELAQSGIPKENVEVFHVPGAFEIPLFSQRLARTGRYDALIACGLVVNGGVYRHEFVAAAVIDALMKVQLETEVPILSCVLTPRDFHEHEDHLAFFKAHLLKKGTEVASACVQTLENMRALTAMPRTVAARS